MILKLCNRCKKNLIPIGNSVCEDCKGKYKTEKRNRDRKDYFKKYNRERSTIEKEMQLFYASNDWQELRKFILAKYKWIDIWEYYENHNIVEANIVHHIIETKVNPSLRMNKENLIPVSYKTHQMFHNILRDGTEEEKRQLIDKLREYCKRFREEFNINL